MKKFINNKFININNRQKYKLNTYIFKNIKQLYKII